MKIIDRYLIKHLLLPFLFCFISLFFIFVIMDLYSSLDDFLSAHAPIFGIVKVYVIMLGQISPLIIPFAFFLACVYLLSNLSAHKELVSLMSAGVSLTRLVVPFLCISILLSGVEYYLYIKLAPTSASRREELMQQWSKKNKQLKIFTGLVYKNPATGVMWYIQQLDTTQGSITQAEITIPNEKGGDKEKYFVAQGNYRNGSWDLVGIRKITYKNNIAAPPENLGQLNATFLHETPKQLAAVLLQAEGYPWPELSRFVNAPHQASPVRMAPFKTEYYRRFADPFLALVLCLFAFALSIVHDRKNRAGAIVNCMLILVTIFVVSKICIAVGNKNRISAPMAGWFPVISYGTAAVILFCQRVGIWWELVYIFKYKIFRLGKKNSTP